MTTETQILTDEFISALWDEIHASFSRETFRMSHHDFARHIEAAVLQSPEIRGLVEALQTIAKYPATRDEEMSMNSARATAGHALSRLEKKS